MDKGPTMTDHIGSPKPEDRARQEPKAFSGQLVSQDRNDEPASMLLARIKAEKAARAKPDKQSRKIAA